MSDSEIMSAWYDKNVKYLAKIGGIKMILGNKMHVIGGIGTLRLKVKGTTLYVGASEIPAPIGATTYGKLNPQLALSFTNERSVDVWINELYRIREKLHEERDDAKCLDEAEYLIVRREVQYPFG